MSSSRIFTLAFIIIAGFVSLACGSAGHDVVVVEEHPQPVHHQTYHCDFCGAEFNSQHDLDSHVSHEHH